VSDREWMWWIFCGIALHSATWFTIGYLIGVNR